MLPQVKVWHMVLKTSIEKPNGRLSGRVSYNYGKSDYKIDVINEGRWYPYRFDKTHSLTMLSNFQLTSNFQCRALFYIQQVDL